MKSKYLEIVGTATGSGGNMKSSGGNM